MGNATQRNVKQEVSDKSAGNSEHPEKSKLTRSSNFRKTSSWSLGSLNDRLNWSFLNTSKSFHSFNRSGNKSLRKESNSTRHIKTVWPVPLTDSIFLPHFKRIQNNEKFVIQDVIAKGAFGIVFKVHDKDDVNIVYALKVLNKSKIIGDNSVQQIKEEIEIQKVCGHHSFIVKQFDSWQTRRHLNILLEYLPSGELFAKICTFPYELVRLYVAEIALALDFLHNAGIIYRDVKPENILLTKDYHIKLTDFGLSKWLKFGERTKTMCGTFQYMAPEILKGEPYGHAVDWWALGVVACRMFTNEFPNADILIRDCVITEGSNSILERGLQEKQQGSMLLESEDNFFPHNIDTIPNAAQDLLRRLLERNSKYRLKSVLELRRIALYKGYELDITTLMEYSPIKLLQESEINSASCSASFTTF